MSTTNPVGSKVFATTQINATNKIVDFVKSGKTDNKTIENSKVLSAVLRFLAAISMPFTMPVTNVIDGIDSLRCIVLNRGINSQIKKVDSIAREILNTSANKPELVKKKKEEMAAAVNKLQARVENKSKGSFADKVEFFADAKKVLERDLKAANTDQIKEITATLVGGAYLTLVKASANEVAANFPLVDETMATEQAKKLAQFTGRPESEVLMDIRFQIKENKTAKSIDESKAALVKLNGEYNTQGHDHADIVARQATLKSEHDCLAGTIDGEMEATRKTADDNLKKTNESISALLNLYGTYFTTDVTGNLGTNVDLALNNFGAKIAGLSEDQKKKLNESFTQLVTLYGDRAKFQKELDAAVKAKVDAGTKCHEMARRFKRDWTVADASGHLYDANLLKSEMVNDNNEKIAKLDRVVTAQSSEAYKAANKPVVNKNIVQAKVEQLNDAIRLLTSPALPAAKIDGARAVINTLGLQGKVYGAVYDKYSSTMTPAERSHPQAGENACFTAAEQANNLLKVQIELQAIIVELESSIVN